MEFVKNCLIGSIMSAHVTRKKSGVQLPSSTCTQVNPVRTSLHPIPSNPPCPPRLSSLSILTMMSARVARSGLRAAQQFSAPRAAVNNLRTYATPAQEVRPPVALFGVDGTYATALV